MKHLQILGLVLCSALAGGAIATQWPSSNSGEGGQITCRPSAPEKLPAGPRVLFWGNSLAFDHHWRLPGYQVVNCARQGMTAEAAMADVSRLPQIDPTAIAVFFGTVELLRTSSDLAVFRAAVDANLAELKRLYPNATVVLFGIPDGPGSAWSYAPSNVIAAKNEILETRAGTVFIETTPLLSDIPPDEQSYDGIHLSATSYGRLEMALAAQLPVVTQN